MTSAPKPPNPLKSDPAASTRKWDLYWSTLTALLLAATLGVLSMKLPVAQRVGVLDFALAVPLAVGALLAIVGSVMRALAHPHGGEMDYWGKLCGVGAAVLALFGVLTQMPEEQQTFITTAALFVSIFIVVSLVAGLIVETVLKRRQVLETATTNKARPQQPPLA